MLYCVVGLLRMVRGSLVTSDAVCTITVGTGRQWGWISAFAAESAALEESRVVLRLCCEDDQLSARVAVSAFCEAGEKDARKGAFYC